MGVLKLNCDASFIHESMARGKINNVLSAFHAELIACPQDIQVASDQFGNWKSHPGDRCVECSASDRADRKGVLIEELKAMALLNFSNFIECKFLGTTDNRAAHVLTGLGYDCIQGEVLISSSVPDDVGVIIFNDLSVISNEIGQSFFKKRREVRAVAAAG